MINLKKITVLFFLIVLVINATSLYGQKPLLPDTAYKIWTEVGLGNLSPNGKYASYQIKTGSSRLRTTVITATNKSWMKEFATSNQPIFSRLNDRAYLTVNGALIEIALAKGQVDTLDEVSNFELVNGNNKEYLIYLTKKNTLVVHSTLDSKTHTFPNVRQFWSSGYSGTIIFTQKSINDGTDTLRYFNVLNVKMKTLFVGEGVDNVIFNNDGSSIAFSTSSSEKNKSLWYFNKKSDAARPLFCDSSLVGGLKLSFNSFYQFSADGRKVLFTLESPPTKYKEDTDPDVWSYEDVMAYSEFKNSNFRKYRVGANLSSVNVSTGQITRIASPDEDIASDVYKIGDIIPLQTVEKRGIDQASRSYTLYNLQDGTRQLLKTGSQLGIRRILISPDQNWVIYYDVDQEQWINYNLKTKVSVTFAQDLMPLLRNYNGNRRMKQSGGLEVFGWIKGTDRVLMQGTYDVWELSVSNSVKPINLTQNGQDKLRTYTLISSTDENSFMPSETVRLFAQDQQTKITSLYKLSLGDRKLTKLMEGNFYWEAPYGDVGSTTFQKAPQAEAYLFKRPSVEQTPNYYFTSDFVTIFQLTDVHPEQSYNWLRSELLNYMDSNGNNCQAILYKPENFDPNKKYPVIFSIYNEQSQWLNRYLSPELPSSGLDIPLMVSNGYLVCKPDMYIEKGKVGPCILNSINAVADYLIKFNWVDSTKLGLEGHSYGGWEVNYILTKTNRFAAAMEGAGASNMIVSYNDLFGSTGQEQRGYVTAGYYWMGESLEENLSNYLDHSPIINAQYIHTPLLMHHNPDDKNVPFYHATHFFLQLRSLGKKVWLLSYPNEGHILIKADHKKDFQYRVKSFFDYYLKNEPIPQWLNRPIK